MASDHLYRDIERRAKRLVPEMRAAIQKFRSLPLEERKKQPLLYWLLGTGTPAYKADKQEAGYVDETNISTQYCANCIHMYHNVLTKKNICAYIEGEVEPRGWCKWWIQ